MNVKSVFLNDKISEFIFVEQPSDFEDTNKPNHVYKLSKALYGLKQVPRAWYERLRDFFLFQKVSKLRNLILLFSLNLLQMISLYIKFILITSFLDLLIKFF